MAATLESMMHPFSAAVLWPRRVSVFQGLPGGYDAAESSSLMSSFCSSASSSETFSGVSHVKVKDLAVVPMPPAPKIRCGGMLAVEKLQLRDRGSGWHEETRGD